MKKYFNKTFSSLGYMLIGIHGIGVAISFLFFSYQYAREHGFLRWLLLGEIIPILKSIVWEVFLVLALIQSPSHTSTNPVLEQLIQNDWWISEYPALIEAVEQASDNTLSTSYMTGPNLTSKVEFFLSKKPDNGLVLKIILPKEAVFSVDHKTGEELPSETTPIIIIRDHDLDGLPDDFQMEGASIYKERYTNDGFTIYRDAPEHQFILAQWVIVIGYSTNYFLHEVDSYRPR